MVENLPPPRFCDPVHLQQEIILLRNELTTALQANAELRIENQILRDEIARLKGTSPRPKIPPGGLENSGKKQKDGGSNNGSSGRGKHPRNKKTGLVFHNVNRLRPNTIPEGAVFKGTRKYDVQDLVCQAHNTRYEIERWQLPDGTYIEGQLPLHIQGHYGAALRAHAITLAHSCRVTEELILEQLRRYKIAISAGQLHAILTENHADFHAEKADLLAAGIASGQIQTDDVGTRHCSKNCYTNVICNEHFVFLTTTDSKNRINFLTVLAQGRREYLFNQDAYDYLAAYKDTEWELYQDLKAYKESPNELARCRISKAFDALFNPEKPTSYRVLNDRLRLTYAKKDRLLFVLERPTTPLHNNLSETGGRGAKVKSKISGGTRSDEGRQAWDTFGSLNLTCRRLGICFYDYLMDRLLDLNKIANLGTIIQERVKAATTVSPRGASPPILAEALGTVLSVA